MKKEFELYRKVNGLLQKQLAQNIGVSVITYRTWVNGKTKPRNNVMQKFQKFYDENIKREEVAVTQKPVKVINKRKMEKLQLWDAMDLLQRLKDGDTVYVTDTEYTLKFVDGFIIRYKGDDVVSINAPIPTSEQYHVFVPIPLNLKVGKRYKTEDGRIATIYMDQGKKFNGVFDNSGEVDVYDCYGNAEGRKINNLIEEA